MMKRLQRMKATKEEKDEIAGTPVKKSKKKKKDNSTKPLKTKTDKPPGLHKKTRKVISEEVEFEGTTNNGCKKGEKKMKHKEGKVAEEEKLESEEAGQHLKKTKKSVKNEVCLESCDTPVKKKKKKKKMEELIHGDSTNGNADALELAREDHDELLKKRKKSKVKVLKIAEETKVASAELLVESVGKTKKKKNHHHPLEPVGEDLDELPKKRKKSKVKVLKIAEETKDADAKLLVESVGKTKKKKKHCHPLELVGEDHDELPKKRKKSKVKVLKMTEETKDADAKLLVESVGKTKKKKKHCHPLELVGEDHDELPKKRKKSKVKVLKMTEETKAAGAKLLVKSVGKTKKKKRKHCHSEETSEETLPKRKKVREAGDTASEDEEKCVKKASLMEGKAGKKAKKSQEVHHKEEDGGQTCNVKKKKKLKRKEGVSCRIEEMAKWEEDPKGLSRSDVEGSPGSKISKKKVKVEEEPTAEPVKKQKKDKLKKRSKTDGHDQELPASRGRYPSLRYVEQDGEGYQPQLPIMADRTVQRVGVYPVWLMHHHLHPLQYRDNQGVTWEVIRHFVVSTHLLYLCVHRHRRAHTHTSIHTITATQTPTLAHTDTHPHPPPPTHAHSETHIYPPTPDIHTH
nr:PREDICTED: lysine-rich nucleolar protein 1 isoform X5 [Latimeria chalumnae]|eukprot:XP_005999697.2 PREDICTED: lysine-rich nucleolar protein 1 isoform X5 [Latimeria chalumnae]